MIQIKNFVKSKHFKKVINEQIENHVINLDFKNVFKDKIKDKVITIITEDYVKDKVFNRDTYLYIKNLLKERFKYFIETSCCVCYEICNRKTKCNHMLSLDCENTLTNKIFVRFVDKI